MEHPIKLKWSTSTLLSKKNHIDQYNANYTHFVSVLFVYLYHYDFSIGVLLVIMINKPLGLCVKNDTI